MNTQTVVRKREPKEADSQETQAPGETRGKCPIHTMFDGAGKGPLARRLLVLGAGLVAYAMFFGTILYAIGFVSNLVVPKGIDTGEPAALGLSLLINGALLALFVVQHTIMARPAFKRWFTRFIPEAMERSIFVGAASACLMLLFWQWRPLPQVVWHVNEATLRWLLIAVSMAGWGIVFASSFMINHFDLFGLRQSFYGFLGRKCPPVSFRLTAFYRFVRHPLMVGFLIAFWATPTMTVGHLFFAVMTTGYIFLGTAIEERDLVAALGEKYIDYRRRVRGFIPIRRAAGPVRS